ncbi:MAG: serine hydrolase [Clostridia bacterium]|nr:serine hydrolase [Clostridia bacterium]
MQATNKLSHGRIYEFYKKLEENGIENHGLLIMKGHEILFEEYAYPYCAEMPHTLFSVTKSIVATAAGFALEEGLFALDSKIADLFPEYEKCSGDGWEELTVRSVLTMQSNKEFSFLQDMTGNYTEMFMKAPFRKNKGFLYSNNDAHIVAALVQKYSGMNLVEYLTPRLFEPLGIEPPEWETNSLGECIGGTGAYLKLRDLALISRCYADGGRFNGVQVIPEWWTREATKIQLKFDNRNREKGYGYLFWIDNGIFSMTGMYGQLVSYVPQYDAVVAVFSSAVEDKYLSTFAENILLKAFEEEPDEEGGANLRRYLDGRGEKPVACANIPQIPDGKTFYITRTSDALAKLMFPASLIPRSITSSFAKRPKSNIDKLSFELGADSLTVKWYEEEDEVKIACGLDGKPRLSECRIKGYYYKIWAYAYSEGGTFKAVVKPLNTLATQRITFGFSKNTVTMQMADSPSFAEFIKKNANQSSFVKNSGRLRPILMKGIGKFLAIGERPIKFRAK